MAPSSPVGDVRITLIKTDVATVRPLCRAGA